MRVIPRYRPLLIVVISAIIGINSVQGVTISNSAFNTGTESDIGDVTQSITAAGPDIWVLGGHDGGDLWDVIGGAATKTAGGEATGMTQYTQNNQATTGAITLTFDLNFVSGGTDQDLGLYVMGWQSGDTAPSLDYENGTLETADSFVPNGSVNLITETTGTEGVLMLVTNNAASYTGVTDGGGLQTITVNLDLGTGYDFVGIAFYGENGGGTMQIDNVQYVIPEPGSALLLSSSALLILLRRRR